jgi:hypothetical protein
MPKLALPLLLVLLVLLPACAGLSVPDSGFLADRDQLQPAPEYDAFCIPDDVELDTDEAALPGDYDSVLIEPTVWTPNEEPKHEPSEKKQASLAEDFDEWLERILDDRYTIVEEPGPRTLRVRASIAEVNPGNVLINIIGLLVLFPPDMGGIACEIEAVDSVTGERRVGLAARRDGGIFLLFECFTTYGHARHGMKKLSQVLLAELQGPDPAPEG